MSYAHPSRPTVRRGMVLCFNVCLFTQTNRHWKYILNAQGVPQSQSASDPETKRKTEIPKTIAHVRSTCKCMRSIKTSSLFPKRGYCNSKQDWKILEQGAKYDPTWNASRHLPQRHKNKNRINRADAILLCWYWILIIWNDLLILLISRWFVTDYEVSYIYNIIC